MKFQKITAMALAVLMLASLAACGDAKGDTPITPDSTVTEPSDAAVTPSADDAGLIGDNTQIPNPWTDCDTVKDAASAADFDLTAPAAIAGEAQSAWRVMTGDQTIFEVRYGDGVILRKAAGTGDISGDFSDYSESQEIETGGVTVTARGNGGAVHCAVWEAGGSTFSLTSDDGLTADEVAAIVAEIA